MDRINRGEIWTVELTAHPKTRPALVISINPVNDLCPDVILVPITTKSGPLRVPISDAEERSGLKIASFVKCEFQGPVHKTRLKKKIGNLTRSEMLKSEAGIKKVLGFD